ncbi:tyrosine-type recombinase/integrase [Compostimonas suwonensis]|uniref:Site-specific recombinase XerD n=1 Tax=Compostimonas suwonensis TaxID=1048394 RepID=A0A2M9BW54_9MICO|nr:site-specific integrase [Compostimonas suwonensis]PJJ62171.1 site-specific recombinase XerD [Compostimonas suwonensis]
MGSIHAYTTSQGERYRVAYRKPDHSQGSKRGFTTKREARLFLASVDVAQARGEFVDPAAARTTIAELGPAWLARRRHLKASYYRSLESAWRVHVEPTWGEFPVGRIQFTDVQAWVSKLAASHSSTTVSRNYGVLAGILDDAVTDRRLPRNPARGASLPRRTKKRRVYLTHTQVQILADSAGDKRTLVYTLAYTGLRWGEATGLPVRDVDPLRRRLTVNENAVNVGGRIIVGTPKSHEVRSVPFPAFLASLLAGESAGKQPEQLVFGDGERHLRSPDSRDGWFVNAIARAKLTDKDFPTLTIHDLRHTAASLAISAGANVKAVQRMLGHASAAMTLDTYADLFDDDLDAVATALNQVKMSTVVVELLSQRPAKALQIR